MFPNNSNGKKFVYLNLLKIKCIDFARRVYFSVRLMETKQNKTKHYRSLQIFAHNMCSREKCYSGFSPSQHILECVWMVAGLSSLTLDSGAKCGCIPVVH